MHRVSIISHLWWEKRVLGFRSLKVGHLQCGQNEVQQHDVHVPAGDIVQCGPLEVGRVQRDQRAVQQHDVNVPEGDIIVQCGPLKVPRSPDWIRIPPLCVSQSLVRWTGHITWCLAERWSAARTFGPSHPSPSLISRWVRLIRLTPRASPSPTPAGTPMSKVCIMYHMYHISSLNTRH